MLRRSPFSLFSKIGGGYRNTRLQSESTIVLAPEGRGHAGTARFYNEAMTQNVKRVENELREAALKKLKGCELEELESASKNAGKNQANH